MSIIATNIPFTPLLTPRNISLEKIRNWNITQLKCLTKTIQIIESESSTICLYNISIYEDKDEWTKKIHKHTKSYLRKKNKPNKGERNEIVKMTQGFGLLIPIEDISNADYKVLRGSMNVLSHMVADFEYIDLLDTLSNEINSEESNKLPIHIVSLLYTLERYINLAFFSKSILESVAELDGYLSHFGSLDKHQLSLQQFFNWFYNVVDQVTINHNPLLFEDEELLHPEVAIIIGKHKKAIITELRTVKESNSKYFFFNTFPELKNDILLLMDLDKDLITVDSFITYFREINFKDKSSYLKYVEKSNNEDSLLTMIGKGLTRKSILNKFKSIINTTIEIDDFSLFSSEQSEYKRLIERRSRLTNDEYEALKSIAKSTFLTANTNYYLNVSRRYEDYQLFICNQITRPLYFYENLEAPVLPKLNIGSVEQIEKSLNYLAGKNAHEKAESDILNSYLTSLNNAHSRVILDRLIEKVPSFMYVSNQRKWNIAVEQANQMFASRKLFRIQKMKELGIDKDENFTDAQKEIFLSEMLKIENEIQNFVPFVTAAFKAALPSKRFNKFDAFRHQSDGIEFDPETVFDPEKWLRGNVMKTLKSSTKKGEIIQVNCFCLDLSGSMDHQRMRNLYKMLYLLVTGLQSRKSYDAFHFFSNNFIPGVDYNYEYTRKNLLFKILTIVSRVRGPRLLFTGLEGTNISQGILGCEERMLSFVDKLKSMNPDINLSCSMFVITDGLPSLGITNLSKLNKFIDERRKETGIAIKGIYIRTPEDKTNIITKIFGEQNSVETNDFEEGVQKLTNIMSKTYLQQRRDYKWIQRRSKMNDNKK